VPVFAECWSGSSPSRISRSALVLDQIGEPPRPLRLLQCLRVPFTEPGKRIGEELVG
jgi:hypothetical protein